MTYVLKPRRAFTLVELLVVIAIIGTLVGLLLPAVQAARESGRRNNCNVNLRELAKGVHLFSDQNNGLLPNSARPGTVRISWITRILPVIEQQPLYDKYDQNANWGSGTANTAAGRTQWRVSLRPKVGRAGSSVLEVAMATVRDPRWR